jgi:protein-S-isoprenylcysteine O-methyltransferase Ste14
VTASVGILVGAEFFLFAVLLFGSAGTLAWPAAWAYLLLFLGPLLLIKLVLARDDPVLLSERMKPAIQKDQPLWDKIILLTYTWLFAGVLVLIGLDAGRFHWSTMPALLQWLGAAGVLISMWFISRVFRVNPYLANVVKIQTERGHQVVTTGPYAFVRHPLYAATLLFLPSTALMLGSTFGLIAMLLLASVLMLRTALEDRELHARLDGYRDYAQRVRYRLIPLVW